MGNNLNEAKTITDRQNQNIIIITVEGLACVCVRSIHSHFLWTVHMYSGVLRFGSGEFQPRMQTGVPPLHSKEEE